VNLISKHLGTSKNVVQSLVIFFNVQINIKGITFLPIVINFILHHIKFFLPKLDLNYHRVSICHSASENLTMEQDPLFHIRGILQQGKFSCYICIDALNNQFWTEIVTNYF